VVRRGEKGVTRIRRSQNLLQNERHKSRSCLTELGPGVFAPILWKFTLDNWISIAPEFAIEFYILRLSWWNKLLMHDVFNIKRLAHFRSWFWSKVVKNAFHHRLTSGPSRNAETNHRFASGVAHYHQMLL